MITYFSRSGKKLNSYLNDKHKHCCHRRSYICEKTDTFGNVKQFLVKNKNNTNNAVILDEWFGEGGMLDWSNKDGALWIHNNKRYENLV